MDLVPPESLIDANAIGKGDFCAIGESMVHRLIGRKLIRPSSKVLDIGCGLGRLARPLTHYLRNGQYHGLDINRSSIDWCRENYENYPNFHFSWFDAYSGLYNANGQINAADYVFPFANDAFDFVMLTSVFTHMTFDGVDNYLSEIARMMKVGGACLATYFLLTRRMRRTFARAGRYSPVHGGFVATSDVPEAFVFLNTDEIHGLYRKHQLRIESTVFGSWSGRRIATGHQDEITAIKPARNFAGLERVWHRARGGVGRLLEVVRS